VDEYGSRGLKVLCFPCNQFAGQEPGTHDEILKFVEDKFKASKKFTWFEKGDVIGSKSRDVFSLLKQELPAEDGATIKWNFTKFLVTHDGKPQERFGPKTPPFAMKKTIEQLLKNKEESEHVKGD